MSISKELFKKEEKYAEIQTQLEESTKKMLPECGQYKEEQELLLSSFKDESKELRNDESSDFEKAHQPTEENKDALFYNPHVLLEQEPTSGVADTTSILTKNLQELKRCLSALMIAQTSDREETQDSEDELAENIFGPKNNIECSDHEPKFEDIEATYRRLDEKFYKLKRELEIRFLIDKLYRIEMQHVKRSYEIKSEDDQQYHMDQQAMDKQGIEEVEKSLREHGKLVKILVTAIKQQEKIMDKLEQQTALFATVDLCEVTEKKFRELLNLCMPEETKPTP